jgi:probable phosphomutase (TIGR03848 family)
MTTFLLIRHAAHSLGGEVIAGRSPGVHLSDEGHRQARDLAERLTRLGITAIYSSPLDRTRETAQPLADRLGLAVHVREELNEIDFGDWTLQSIDELRARPIWSPWNEYRSGTRIPGGELMLETQLRIVREMDRLRGEHPDACIACFSHGDVIKAAVAHALGVPLDLFRRIEIALASVSVIAVGDYGPWVLGVNHTGRIELPQA